MTRCSPSGGTSAHRPGGLRETCAAQGTRRSRLSDHPGDGRAPVSPVRCPGAAVRLPRPHRRPACWVPSAARLGSACPVTPLPVDSVSRAGGSCGGSGLDVHGGAGAIDFPVAACTAVTAVVDTSIGKQKHNVSRGAGSRRRHDGPAVNHGAVPGADGWLPPAWGPRRPLGTVP